MLARRVSQKGCLNVEHLWRGSHQIISRTQNVELAGEGAGDWQNITDTKTPAIASHLHLAPNSVEGSFISELPINGVLQLGAANPISLSALGNTVYNYLQTTKRSDYKTNQIFITYLNQPSAFPKSISANFRHISFRRQLSQISQIMALSTFYTAIVGIIALESNYTSFLSSAKLWHYQHFTQLSHPLFNSHRRHHCTRIKFYHKSWPSKLLTTIW